jgi:integrase
LTYPAENFYNPPKILLNQEDDNMQVSIQAREKCPKCGKEFLHYKRLGFTCPSCETIPKRFMIYLYHKGRIRIYSDKQGNVLEGYQQAQNLKAVIVYELKNGTFDPSHYIKSEQKQFWCTTLLDEMLTDRISDIAPSYKPHYKLYINIEKEYFNTRDVRELKNYDIINFDKHLKAGPYPNANSRKKVLMHFKSFLRYCAYDRQVPGLVIPKFPELDTTEPQIPWLNMEDQQTIFNNYIPDADKPIMALLMIYGCRPGEAAALKCKDVDLSNDRFTISSTFSAGVYREKKRKGRNSKPTIKPIVEEVRDYITKMVKGNLPEAWLFPNPRTGNAYRVASLSRLWKKVREKAKLPSSLKLYSATRHSRGSQAANNGVSQKTIQELLGHSSSSSTNRYTHINIESQRVVLEHYTLKKVTSPVLPLQQVKEDI